MANLPSFAPYAVDALGNVYELELYRDSVEQSPSATETSRPKEFRPGGWQIKTKGGLPVTRYDDGRLVAHAFNGDVELFLEKAFSTPQAASSPPQPPSS